METNICRHPVSNPGTAQTDRLLKTLIPKNFRLDSRETEDFMVYTARFAKNIQFWKSGGMDSRHAQLLPDGDWSDFWECDHLFFLASVAAMDLQGHEQKIRKGVLKVLELAGNPDSGHDCDPDECAEAMRDLIDLIFQLASMINDWGEKSKAYPQLQTDFKAAITDDVINALLSLISYDKETPVQENNYDNFIYDCSANEFAGQWRLSKTDYIKIDFINPCAEPYDSARKLERIAREFSRVLFRLRERAKYYFNTEQNGENRRHQPHIALFFAFMHLFRYLTEQLNELPQRHLDHYYERILHLERRKQVPDQTHLVFQLAQGVLRHTMEAQTAFRAGKDTAGRELFYGLEKPLSLNRGKVTEIKTLYVSDETRNLVRQPTAYYEDTILDSDKTTPAPDKMDQVRPFYALGKGGDGEKLSSIGFGISSAEFITSKASRVITVFLELGNFSKLQSDFFALGSDLKPLLTKFDPDDAEANMTAIINKKSAEVIKLWTKTIRPRLAELFKIEISTTEGWIELNEAVSDIKNLNVKRNGKFHPFSAKLTGTPGKPSENPDARMKTVDLIEVDDSSFLAITIQMGKSVAATASPGGIDAHWPVLTVMMENNSGLLDKQSYELLCPIVSKASVTNVFVASIVNDVTDFEVTEASTGIRLPSSKNIEVSRYAGQGLIVRAPEVLKRQLRLIDPKGAEVKPDQPLLNVQVHVSDSRRPWINALLFEDNRVIAAPAVVPRNFKKDRYLHIFKFIDDKIEPSGEEHSPNAVLFIPPPAYADLTISYQSFQCIFQSELTGNREKGLFSNAYPTSVTKNLVTKTDEFRFDDNYDQVLHFLPHHGYQEIKTLHVLGNGNKLPFPLLDPLTIPTNSGGIIPNGNLFIGVQGLETLQTLSLLFQVADGTEDIFDLQTPDIEWSYLYRDPKTGMDRWKRFPSAAILSDTTRADESGKKSLVQSGIVELSIPKDMTDESTVLKQGFHWIRASAVEAYQDDQKLTDVLSLPKLIAIYAQAGKVILLTKEAADSHFARPIPAKTISALKQRQSEILKTDQFFPGFGGRSSEADPDFYRRISERLRHRGRAITAWDYERLVLERFPEVRALKCLQHTKQDEVCANGHVTLAVLPFLRNPAYQQPMQPQPSMALLENIKGYLKKRSGLFAAYSGLAEEGYLHIIRPGYEQVAVAVTVKFRQVGFADQETLMFRLDEAITAYIAPWASDATKPPRFANTLYRTELLCYLETLPYVDYIKILRIGKVLKTGNQVDFEFGTNNEPHALLTPDKPAGILTSFLRLPADTGGSTPDGYVFVGKDDYTPHHLIQVIQEDI